MKAYISSKIKTDGTVSKIGVVIQVTDPEMINEILKKNTLHLYTEAEMNENIKTELVSPLILIESANEEIEELNKEIEELDEKLNELKLRIKSSLLITHLINKTNIDHYLPKLKKILAGLK